MKFQGLMVALCLTTLSLPTLANPLTPLQGRWSGQARVSFKGGATESAKCISTYFVEGNALKQNIRCSNSSYKITLRANLNVSGNNVTGTWSEENFNLEGQANGTTLPGGGMRLKVNGSTIAGQMQVQVSGGAQSIDIRFDNDSFPVINMNLRKN